MQQHLVLARKYRPRNFSEMVGQDYVVTALKNALNQQRLHHAYLFTGTRGVGKTTVSRILAKSLNCVGEDGRGGITSAPCGVCEACSSIDAGRFVDYTELDAASNRGVDEVQALLEQAVYRPAQGRFKVFMIDEVHMLSTTAFNAMLKTLEEPPGYLKFVLATTDPQKIPATVLSRCLQFSLRPMPPDTVYAHLCGILEREGVAFEEQAVRLLAKAATGSMRDALSLTEQAVAFSSGAESSDSEARLRLEQVREMLGAVDTSYIYRLIEALAAGDGRTVLETVDALRVNGLSADACLEEMSLVLQRMAVQQNVPDACDMQDADHVESLRLSALMAADEVQFLYSLCIHGRQELELAPDEYAGLTMTLLRLLAFRQPDRPAQQPTAQSRTAAEAEKKSPEAGLILPKAALAETQERVAAQIAAPAPPAAVATAAVVTAAAVATVVPPSGTLAAESPSLLPPSPSAPLQQSAVKQPPEAVPPEAALPEAAAPVKATGTENTVNTANAADSSGTTGKTVAGVAATPPWEVGEAGTAEILPNALDESAANVRGRQTADAAVQSADVLPTADTADTANAMNAGLAAAAAPESAPSLAAAPDRRGGAHGNTLGTAGVSAAVTNKSGAREAASETADKNRAGVAATIKAASSAAASSATGSDATTTTANAEVAAVRDMAHVRAPAGSAQAHWNSIVRQLQQYDALHAFAGQLAVQAQCLAFDAQQLHLRVAQDKLCSDRAQEKLRAALAEHAAALDTPWGGKLEADKLQWRVERGAVSCSYRLEQEAVQAARQQAAEAAFMAAPTVQALMRDWDAVPVSGSIQPVNAENAQTTGVR